MDKIWSVLEIEPTDDLEVIKTAYRNKLVHTNPEDNPEGFKELREAFEKACEEATKTETEPESPYKDLMGKISEIYEDIFRRVDINIWDELFSDPIFSDLEQQDAIRREFLIFTMDYYTYPGNIWEKLDEVFSITAEQDRLKEEFPPNFITYIVNCIENGGEYVLDDKIYMRSDVAEYGVDDISIELAGVEMEDSEISLPIDDYILRINELERLCSYIDDNRVPSETKDELIQRLGDSIVYVRNFEYYSPCEEVAAINYLHYVNRTEECLTLINNALNRDGFNESSLYYKGRILYMYLMINAFSDIELSELPFSEGFLDKTEALMRPGLQNQITRNENRAVIALCEYFKGNKKEARDYIIHAQRLNRDRADYSNLLDKINDERNIESQKRLKEDPDDMEALLVVGWDLFRKEKSDDCIKLLDGYETDEEHEDNYHNLLGQIYLDKGDGEKSLTHLLRYNEILKEKEASLGPAYPGKEFSLEEVKVRTNIPYSEYLISLAYARMEKWEDAKLHVLKALEDKDGNTHFEYAKVYGFILSNMNDYRTAVQFWTEEIEKENAFTTNCHIFRQYAAYKGGDVRTAIDDYYYLKEEDPEYIDSYAFAGTIFLDYNDLESYEELKEAVDEHHLEDIMLDYNYGRYLRLVNKHLEARKIFSQIYLKLEKGEGELDNPARFYVNFGYNLLDILKERLDEEDKEVIKTGIGDMVDKAHKAAPDAINPYWLELDYMEYMDKDEEPLLEKMLKIFSDNADVYYEYAKCLERKSGHSPRYLELLEKGREKNPDHKSILSALADYYISDEYKDKENIGAYAKARECISHAMEVRGDVYLAVRYLLILIDGMEYEKCIELGKKFLEDYSNDAYILNAIGNAYLMLDRYDEAENFYKLSIENHKGTNRIASYTNLVKCYEIQGRYKEAIEAYKNYIERYKLENSNVHDKLAGLYEDDGDFDAALQERMKVIYLEEKDIVNREPEEQELKDIHKFYLNDEDADTMNYGDLVEGMLSLADTYFYLKDYKQADSITDSVYKFMEEADVFLEVDYMDQVDMKAAADIAWKAARHYLYHKKDYNMTIRIGCRFLELMDNREVLEIDNYEDMADMAIHIARSYYMLDNKEKAAEYSDRAQQLIKKGYGSVDAYLNFPLYKPLRLCKYAELLYLKGEKEAAYEALNNFEKYCKCSFCKHRKCVDRYDRLALFAYIEGDMEKTKEYYTLGTEYGGSDIERISGLRELEQQSK